MALSEYAFRSSWGIVLAHKHILSTLLSSPLLQQQPNKYQVNKQIYHTIKFGHKAANGICTLLPPWPRILLLPTYCLSYYYSTMKLILIDVFQNMCLESSKRIVDYEFLLISLQDGIWKSNVGSQHNALYFLLM